jgi:hypothetical protein
MFILDNANWFIPNENTNSPNSPRERDGPAHSRWAEFLLLTEDWRSIWTSSGVIDAAIYFKL